MVFNSILFLFRFMPAAFLLYYLTPRRWKNLLLFLLSVLFYCWGEVRYVPLMLASTLVNYAVGRGIEKFRRSKVACRLFLALSVTFNLGSLLFFKYANFFIGNINTFFGCGLGLLSVTLPLSISFYTLRTMAYSIDVCRGNSPVERDFIDFAAFVTLFPQLIAGPIVKYTDISVELKERKVCADQIQRGVFTFIMGLGSKVLIADNIGYLWNEVEALGFANISTPLAWMGVLAFSLQIYFDFGGYSLMAIGLGHMLGFEFPQNFNYPYIAKSVTEFWRRWHMTLGGWFREYVYIPLGGNHKGKVRQYFNIFVVLALIGFWHGASWSFVCWGLYFAVFLCLEKMFLLKWLKKGRVWSRMYLLFTVVLGWALFAVADFGQLRQFLHRMFVFSPGMDWVYYLRNYGITFIMGILLSTPILKRAQKRLNNPAADAVFSMAVLVASVAYLVDSSYNPFLYFRI